MKTIGYYLKSVILILQTVLAFALIYYKNTNKVLNLIILGFLAGYLFVLVVMIILNKSKHKFSQDTLLMYKKSMKLVSRAINIVFIVMSILTIISAKSETKLLISSVFLLLFNLIMLYINFKGAERAEKKYLAKKKRERKKNEANGQANYYNYHKHSKEKL